MRGVHYVVFDILKGQGETKSKSLVPLQMIIKSSWERCVTTPLADSKSSLQPDPGFTTEQVIITV
jgi:hypothetical protein